MNKNEKLRVSRNQNIFFAIVAALCAVVLSVIDVGPALRDALVCARGIVWGLSIFSAVIAVMLNSRIKS